MGLAWPVNDLAVSGADCRGSTRCFVLSGDSVRMGWDTGNGSVDRDLLDLMPITFQYCYLSSPVSHPYKAAFILFPEPSIPVRKLTFLGFAGFRVKPGMTKPAVMFLHGKTRAQLAFGVRRFA